MDRLPVVTSILPSPNPSPSPSPSTTPTPTHHPTPSPIPSPATPSIQATPHTPKSSHSHRHLAGNRNLPEPSCDAVSFDTSSMASVHARGIFPLIATAADVTHSLTVGELRGEEGRGRCRGGEGRGGGGGGYVTHERLRTRGLRRDAAAIHSGRHFQNRRREELQHANYSVVVEHVRLDQIRYLGIRFEGGGRVERRPHSSPAPPSIPNLSMSLTESDSNFLFPHWKNSLACTYS